VNRRLVPYFLLVSVAMMAMGGIFALLGELRDELGFSETGLGVAVAMGFFSAFGAQIGLARFADRGHSQLMMRLGLISVAVSLALLTLAAELWQFVAIRMLLGLGIGMLMPAVRRLVIVSDPDMVGANVGAMGAFEVGGFLVGPLLSGVLAEFYGYRAPFIVLAVITAAFVPRIARLPADPGSLTEERRVVRALLAEPGVRAILTCAFGWFAMIGVFESVWAVMLTDRGAATWLIGVTMSLIMLPMLFIAPLSGSWAQRVGPLRAVRWGVLFVAPLFFAYGFIDSLLLLTLVAVLQGVGDAIVFPGTQVGVAVAAPEDLTASAQGLQGATLELTAGTMALWSGFMYEQFGPKAVFSSGAALMLIGVAGSYIVARTLGAGHPLLGPSRGRALNPAPAVPGG
jgi:MFS family permease